MGFFDAFHMPNMADPETVARIRGALLGAGQAAGQPYGNLGSIAGGAGMGAQTGLNNYYQGQSNKLGIANSQLEMQQKIGPMNFMRALQGQKPLTVDELLGGSFRTPPLSMDGPGTGGFAGQNIPASALPPPIPLAPNGPPPSPSPIPNAPNAPMGSPIQYQTGQASQPSSIIPPEMAANPIFQAALQSGDSGTVLKMLTTGEYDKTPHQGINPATGKTGDYVLGPGGSVKWLEVNEPAKAPPTAGGMYYDQASNGFLPIPGYTDQAKAIAEAGRAPVQPKQNWQILTDPKTQTQYRYDMDSGRALTLDGQPYAPGGAAKLASGGTPRSPQAAIMQKYMLDNPNASADDLIKMGGKIREQISAADRFGSGPLGTQVKSFNVAISHLDTLQELGNALKNGDVKAINAASNRVADEFGVAAPNNFELAKTVVGDEIAKAIIAGVGSVTDRTALQDRFSRANSPDALVGVIKTAQALMSGQVKGLKKQYENSTQLDDFNDKLFPRTRQILGLDDPSNGGADVPATPQAKQYPVAPSAAIQTLKMNRNKAAFDEVFGPGAADKALNGR